MSQFDHLSEKQFRVTYIPREMLGLLQVDNTADWAGKDNSAGNPLLISGVLTVWEHQLLVFD